MAVRNGRARPVAGRSAYSSNGAPILLELQRLVGNNAVRGVVQRCGPVACDCTSEEQAAVASVQRQVVPAAQGRERCCEQEYPGAVPIWWPTANWHPSIGDPGSQRPEFDLPTENPLVKRGSGLYDPSRPEIARYDRIISGPPFNLQRPSGWPIHHKVPLMLGGWGDSELAAGEYGPSGEVLQAPNLVVMSPDAHDAWHRVLKEQPRGPRKGEGPTGAAPDGTTFCVLDLMPDQCVDDQQDDLKESALAQAALNAGRQLSEWWEGRKRASAGARTGSVAAGGEAAAAAGASRLGGLLRVAGRVAAKVSLVLTIADVVLTMAGALASHAYGSIYSGTRGARLEQTLQQLGLRTQTLAHECGYALGLQEALLQAAQTSFATEPETHDLRQELFKTLTTVRGTIYHFSVELDRSVRGSSAIAKRIDRSEFENVKTSLALADALIAAGDTSTLALDMLAGHLVDVGLWYSSQVERLFDGYGELVHDDFAAWLDERR